jgi:hypothetical protein
MWPGKIWLRVNYHVITAPPPDLVENVEAPRTLGACAVRSKILAQYLDVDAERRILRKVEPAIAFLYHIHT